MKKAFILWVQNKINEESSLKEEFLEEWFEHGCNDEEYNKASFNLSYVKVKVKLWWLYNLSSGM